MAPNTDTATGLTYLAMPMTQFGGPTTAAQMNISDITIYDDALDFAGNVSYNGQTYNFSLFGDLYRSTLGAPDDKVGVLRDATGNFDVLYFAVRRQPLMPVANTSLTAENFSLYLQRKDTREIVFIDSALTGWKGMLWEALNVQGRYGVTTRAEYWRNWLFLPAALIGRNVEAEYNALIASLTFEQRAELRAKEQALGITMLAHLQHKYDLELYLSRVQNTPEGWNLTSRDLVDVPGV